MPSKGKIEDDQPVLLFVRYGMSYYQSCKNSLNRTCPMHQNYTGVVLGVSDSVEVVEGDNWPRHMACAVVWFPSMRACRMWFDCTPEVKQPDWLHGVDIVAVPLTGGIPPPEQGKGCMQVLDIDFEDCEKFMAEYVQNADPFLKKKGASPAMVSSNTHYKFRGLWDPHHVIVNYWPSQKHFHEVYDSEEYGPLKSKRLETSTSDVAIFSLENIECQPK